MRTCRAVFVICLLVLAVAGSVFAQQAAGPNLNRLYAYPASFGLGFVYTGTITEPPENLATGAPDQVLLLGAEASARIPLRRVPAVQPGLHLGLTHLRAPGFVPAEENEVNPGIASHDWSNLLIYAAPGIGFWHRLSKQVDLGGDAFAGIGLVSYSERLPTETITNLALVAGGAIGVNFSPFFNFAFGLRPSVTYRRTLSGLGSLIDRYDGLFWSIDVGLQLRLGRDPDAGEIRAIDFGEPRIEPLFAAMQSYYAQNPVGEVELTNVHDGEITDLEVLFHQAGFMDGPTSAARIDRLAPGQVATVRFPAAFNDQVFQVEGVRPLTGEIVVRYRAGGRSIEQRQPVTYDLYDKTSITWDNDRKMGAVITPSDSSIRSYASDIAQAARNETVNGLPDELQFAMQAYHALADRGMLYQPDPTSPFTQVQEDTFLVDSVSLPRDTINRITGDCDDLTALYNTILETRGIETAFVTTPGHIYSALKLDTPPRDFASVHPDRDMTLPVGDSLWVLVEITVVGRGDFLQAWRTGMTEYLQYTNDPEFRGFWITREAQQAFRPVGLEATSERARLDDPERVVDDFVSDRDQLAQEILAGRRQDAEERDRARDWNRLGIAAAELRQYRTAEEAFVTAGTARGGSEVAAQVNIGSMYFLQDEYELAVEAFRRAQQLVKPDTPEATQVKLLINLSQAHYALDQYQEAADAYEQAQLIDSAAAAEFAFLGVPAETSSARASEAETGRILFVEE